MSGFRAQASPGHAGLLVLVAVLGLIAGWGSEDAEGDPRNRSLRGGQVPIRFRGEADAAIPWDIEPTRAELTSLPGEAVESAFRVRSRSSQQMTVFVRHTVEPKEAAKYLTLVDCSLLTTATLDPGEEVVFPISYFLRPGQPEWVRGFRVTYSLAVLDSEAGRSDRTSGRVIYVERCLSCHGERGKGDGPVGLGLHPPPRDLGPALKSMSESDLLRVVRGGRGAMPAFAPALSDEELRLVLLYLRGLAETGG